MNGDPSSEERPAGAAVAPAGPAPGDQPANEGRAIDLTPVDRAEQAAEAHRDSTPWVLGLILIALGVIFLLQNLRGLVFDNWWALFILIPAVASLARAWQVYRAAGRWTSAARSALVGGLLLAAVAAIFLFGLNWGIAWPVFLIIAGIGALANAVLQD